VGDRWRAVAALVDRSRRALYLYVRRQDHPVSREEAARAERVSRGLAAFHLDKLVEAGLLRARYQAPPGQPRRRGRTPKVYEPAGDLAITVPERRYQLLAEIFADAAAAAPEHAAGVPGHAERQGRVLGARLRTTGGGPTDLAGVLSGLGFDPRPHPGGRIVLGNCPFQAVAARHTELVCGVNLAFVSGLLQGLDLAGVKARLAPRPPACCVELTGPA
jgi:predicted ArsR family transcriptional regulator